MKDKLKKYLLPNLPYLFFVYLFDKLCQTVRLAPGLDTSEKLLHIGQGFQTAFASSAPSFHALDICVGILGAVLVRLAVYVKGKNAKKYRKGIEYGSARWGTAADIAPYVDPVPDWNIPLTRAESLTMTSRPKQPKYARNKNILVIGGSGSGKTRFFVKPSIMQMHSSYVITDPKGQLLKETGKMLLHGAPKLDENGKPVRDSRGKVIYEPYRIIPTRRCRIVDRQHHVRLPDDCSVGFQLCVWLLMCVNGCHVAAFDKHIEIAFAQLRCPLCCLFLVWRNTKQHQFRIIVAQNVNEFGGVKPHAVVAGHGKMRHSLLPQHHDLLGQLHLHIVTLRSFFIKSPCKPHGIVSEDRAAFGRGHSNTCFLSLCKLCANTLVCVISLLIIIVLLTD